MGWREPRHFPQLSATSMPQSFLFSTDFATQKKALVREKQIFVCLFLVSPHRVENEHLRRPRHLSTRFCQGPRP